MLWSPKMRKLVSAAVLAGFLAVPALPSFAQAPAGPQNCKPTEQWDAVTKTCKPM
jgi:hypothetical protein